MKKIFCIVLLLTMIFSACKKDQTILDNKSQIAEDIIQKLKTAGFDTTEGLSKYKNGFLVEGDIFMTIEDINKLSERSKINIPISLSLKNLKTQSKDPISHYRTNDLISLNSSRRTINIFMSSALGTYMQDCLDAAISRYNSLDFGLVFNRTSSSSSADIIISTTYISPVTNPNDAYLMAAGFPTSGNPYNEITVNTYYYNSSYNRLDATSTLVHEIGHTVGLRHTDYMNRAFSCGAVKPGNNEGAGTIGANHIGGTPTGPEYGSVMLACADGSDRSFTLADILSLKALYPYRKNIYIKEIHELIYDDSYNWGASDYDKRSYDITLEFYQDASGTIPYVTSNYFMLTVFSFVGGVDSKVNLLIDNGVSSYHLGEYTVDRAWEFGNQVYDNTSGFQVAYSPFSYYDRVIW
ncbi:M57 family metalloprotease [Pedobacter soli]|uniref:Dual-action HEIGH metallo-peptidase n=1 Tax=Pedobacter soli TaxID=390242 RepID=A0A1G7AQT1_9SPHI|nr:M57 family metalloprotease [Pedobacter soli]SDE17163.1 Dual-action HEIGH metallo-peptidase [Pedobacter soli]